MGNSKIDQMKLTFLLAALAVLSYSCEKEIYGCTDIAAENYSTLANTNDGSCFYSEPSAKSTTATVTNWSQNGMKYVAIIPWSEITTDVIDNGAVMTYRETSTNVWSQLPLTIYESGTYSTTIEVAVTVGQVLISISNSDLSLPAAPTSILFKVSIVS